MAREYYLADMKATTAGLKKEPVAEENDDETIIVAKKRKVGRLTEKN